MEPLLFEPPDSLDLTDIRRPPRPVPFSSRLGALFLDWIVLVCLTAVVGFFFGLLREVSPSGRILDTSLGPMSLVLLCTLPDVAFAASPGKSMLGYIIRTPTGAPAPLRRLALRWLVKCGPLVLLGFSQLLQLSGLSKLFDIDAIHWTTWIIDGVAGIWICVLLLGLLAVLHPARRALHDLVAGTAVFHHDATRVLHQTDARGFEVTPLPTIPAGQTDAAAAQSSPATETSDHPV